MAFKMVKFTHKSGVSFLYPEGWLPEHVPLDASTDLMFSVIKPTSATGEIINQGNLRSSLTLLIIADPRRGVSDQLSDFLSSQSCDKGFQLVSKNNGTDEIVIQFTYETLDSFEHINPKRIVMAGKSSFVRKNGRVVQIVLKTLPGEEVHQLSDFADQVLASLTFQ